MKLLFIDETSDANNPKYLGICAALIDVSKYGSIKRDFHRYLGDFKWDPSIEFKGSWIFSSSKGCQAVPVEKRIELTKRIIEMNSSPKNSNIKFCYISNQDPDLNQTKQYELLIQPLLKRILKSSNTTQHGKDVIAIYCDKRQDIDCKKIRIIISPILKEKKLILLEDIHFVQSNMQTVGLCYADIVGYLMSRIHNITVDSGLFENLDSEEARKNIQLKKFLTSREIIDSIKSMEAYKTRITKRRD